ncbi:hypothetical protein HMPREF0724_13869 [Prescottella equi ATCC 33707]|uniref:Uncharacterized protein n=1 Tax=Prescottella equi ATCC 33707 TaxID=525370 RepID=F1TJG6_RHOHA|nr:hypothetical protein HMPREF0724_13869 [Prescottella equi ATCC 33707]
MGPPRSDAVPVGAVMSDSVAGQPNASGVDRCYRGRAASPQRT